MGILERIGIKRKLRCDSCRGTGKQITQGDGDSVHTPPNERPCHHCTGSGIDPEKSTLLKIFRHENS